MSNQEPNKIIFSMVKLSKFYDKKPVLKDIYLSFFYGAKIFSQFFFSGINFFLVFRIIKTVVTS